MAGSQILVVDDDDDIRGLVRTLLERAGHDVSDASDGLDGLRELYAGSPDLVILDVAMPGLDGWATLERIREVSDVPVLMLTARDAELERVRGLKGGADDYVVKPFGVRELVARIRAVTRRTTRREGSTRLVAGPVEIDTRARSVAVDGRRVELTPKEYDVLVALVGADGAVVSKQRLLQEVWGGSWLGAGKTVDVHVASLRRKLGDPDVVQTVRGVGLRIRA